MSFLKNLVDKEEYDRSQRSDKDDSKDSRGSRSSRNSRSRGRERNERDERRSSQSRSRQREQRDDVDPIEQSKIGQDLMGILLKPAPDQDNHDEDESSIDQVSLVNTPLNIIKKLRGENKLGPPPTMSQIAKQLGVEYISNKPLPPPEPLKLPSREDDENDRKSSRSRKRDSNDRSSRDSRGSRNSRSARSSRYRESRERNRDRDHKEVKSENESKFQKRWSQFDIGNDINIPIEENDNRFGSQLRKHYDGMWKESRDSSDGKDSRDKRSSSRSSHRRRDDDHDRDRREDSRRRHDSHRRDERESDSQPKQQSNAPNTPNALSLVQNLRRGSPETHYFMGNLIAQMNILAKEKQIQWSQQYTAESDPVMAYHEYKVVMEQIELVNKARTLRHKVQRTIKLAEEFSEQIPYLSIKGVTEEIEKEGGYKQYDDDFKLIALQSSSGPRNPWWSLAIGIGLVVVIKWLENVFKGQSMIGFVKKFLELFKKPKTVTDGSSPGLFSNNFGSTDIPQSGPVYNNDYTTAYPDQAQSTPMTPMTPMYPTFNDPQMSQMPQMNQNQSNDQFQSTQQQQQQTTQAPQDFLQQFEQSQTSGAPSKTRTRNRNRPQ